MPDWRFWADFYEFDFFSTLCELLIFRSWEACSITWSVTENLESGFSITQDDGLSRRGAGQCRADIVNIPSAYGGTTVTDSLYTKFCGERLNNAPGAPMANVNARKKNIPLTSEFKTT